jgi:hypothetical protein
VFCFVAVLYFDYIPWWGALVISVGVGLISMVLVQFILVPYEKKRIVGEFLSHAHVTTQIHHSWLAPCKETTNTLSASSFSLVFLIKPAAKSFVHHTFSWIYLMCF